MKIIGRRTSYNVQKVLWLADELSLNYEHIEVGGRFGGNRSGDFLALNPQGKVPVIVDQHKVIYESNTIVRYLAGVYAKGEWISCDPYERSLSDRWLDWSIDRLEPAFVAVFWGYYRTPEKRRNAKDIANGVVDCETHLKTLSHGLGEKGYLLGEQPTVADIATGVFLHRLYAIDLPVAIPKNILGWYRRLCARPGYAKWVMSDFSELFARIDY